MIVHGAVLEAALGLAQAALELPAQIFQAQRGLARDVPGRVATDGDPPAVSLVRCGVEAEQQQRTDQRIGAVQDQGQAEAAPCKVSMALAAMTCILPWKPPLTSMRARDQAAERPMLGTRGAPSVSASCARLAASSDRASGLACA